MAGLAVLLLLSVGGQVSSGFDVRTMSGEPLTGGLESIGADGLLVVGEHTVTTGEWYSLRRRNTALPPWPRSPHAELTTGERVVGAVSEADGDALKLRLGASGGEQTVRLPLSSLRAVFLTTRPAEDPEPDWPTAARKRDLFMARNGDSAAGALTSIDPGHNAVRYQADGKDHKWELSKLAAIGFNTDLARVRRPNGPFYRLTLDDGTRLSVQSIAFDGRTWTAATLFKDTIRIPAERIVSVDVEQSKVTFLSDVKPARYQYHTFDGEQYSWAADRCVTGQALTLKTAAGGSTFDRGVGLHADCSVTYSLAGKYRRFETLAGLDSKSGLRGNAVLAVLVDGKDQPLPGDGRLTTTGGPLAIRIDLAGAKELTIAARRGLAGNVQDHVNLAEAMLIP
jgi:hypothetical protein